MSLPFTFAAAGRARHDGLVKSEEDPAPSRAQPPRAQQSPVKGGRAQEDPLLPVRSPGDSDIGWGGHPEPDDDERLRQDRPPHWDSP
jgi:hypothetical protein